MPNTSSGQNSSPDLQLRSTSKFWQSGDGEGSPSRRQGSTIHSQEHRQCIDSTFRERYEPSQRSLLISQQTSASAMRDMALRMDSRNITECSGDLKMRNKPHKPAMNQSEASSNEHTSKGLNRLSMSDLLKIFPRPNAPDSRVLSPLKQRRSSSAVIHTSDTVSQEEENLQKRQSSAKTRFEGLNDMELPWLDCHGRSRAHVAEPNLSNVAQNTVTKPTIGIRNGFYGCDTSTFTDEAEEKRPRRASSTSPMPSKGHAPGASSKAVQHRAMHDRVPHSLLPCPRERSELADQSLEAS